jgi:hypothetical protein
MVAKSAHFWVNRKTVPLRDPPHSGPSRPFLLVYLAITIAGCTPRQTGDVVITLRAEDPRARPDYALVSWVGPDEARSHMERLPPEGSLFRGTAELGSVHVYFSGDDRSDRRVSVVGFREGMRVSAASARVSWMVQRQALTLELRTDEPETPDAGPPPVTPDAAPPPVATDGPALEAPRSLGLLLRYAFDEDAAGRAADSSGHNYHGQLVGVGALPTYSLNVPPVTFANPRSLAFDKSKRQAVQLAPAPIELKARAVTMAMWYRATAVDATGSEVVSLGGNYGLRLLVDHVEAEKHTSSGRFFCQANPDNHLDGTWHHLAATIRDMDVTVYYDGALIAMCSSTAPILYERGNDLWIGRQGSGGLGADFDGNLDEVRLYDRLLNAADVAALAARRR